MALKEVVVTAEKKKNEIATSYVIDRNAINHMEEGYFMSAPYSVNPSANILLLPVGTWYQVSYNDEKPVNYSLEMKAKWSRNFGQVRSNLLLGSQYNTSGNYGKGVSYADMRYAPTYREFRYDKQPFVNNMK